MWPTPRVVLELGWLALVVIVPLLFTRETYSVFELPKQAALRTILLVSLAVAGAAAWSSRAGSPLSSPDASRVARTWVRQVLNWPPALAALALVLAWALSTALSVAPTTSWWGYYERWAGVRTQLAYVALFLVAAAALTRREQALRLAALASGAASAVALYALIQRLQWDPLDWGSGLTGIWERAPVHERPFATFGNPNFLAAFLTISLFLALGGALGETRPWRRAGWWAAAGMQVLALALTQTRGAWLGTAAGLALFVLLLVMQRGGPWRRWLVASSAVALLLGAGLWLAGPTLPRDSLVGRAASALNPASETAAVRLALWRSAAQLALDRPLLGFGPDTTGAVIARRYAPELVRLENALFLPDRAHNAVLETLATTGLVGGAALLLLGGVMARAGWLLLANHQRGQGTGDGFPRLAGHPLAPAMLAALAAHVVEQQFNLAVVESSFLAWLVAGAVAGCAWNGLPSPCVQRRAATENGADAGQRTTRQRPGSAVLVLCVAGFGAVVMWWEVQPMRADVAYGRANLAQRAQAWPDAMHYLTQAVSIWPHEPVYWSELATARLNSAHAMSGAAAQQLYRQAIEAADQALVLNPAHATLWSNWGMAAGEVAVRSRNAQLAERARLAHATATGLAPQFWRYWQAAGETERKLGNYPAAQAAFARAASLFDDGGTWGALGDAAARAGDLETARQAYQRVLQLSPGDMGAQRALEALAKP